MQNALLHQHTTAKLPKYSKISGFHNFLFSILDIHLTHLFYSMPMPFKLYLHKHILWRGSEDKCNVCNLIHPNIIFKTATLQYHHMVYYIFYSSYNCFCKQGKLQKLKVSSVLLATAHKKKFSSKTGQLVTSVKTLWWIQKFQGTEKLRKRACTCIVSKNTRKRYPYNQSARKAPTKLKPGVQIFRV